MPRLKFPVFFAALALCSTLPVASYAQQPASTSASPTGPSNVAKTRPEALIDALATYPFGAVYTEDINTANSITHAGKQLANGDNGVIPVAPVRNIADLGKLCIPLLIAHLTDTRLTKATYHDQPVPVAYLALDMLLYFTDMNDERVVVPGCEQHGLGDCMQPDFYFSPDSSDPNRLADVQKAWIEEDKRQPIQFVYPQWWRSADAPKLQPMPPGASPKSRPQVSQPQSPQMQMPQQQQEPQPQTPQ